MRPNQVFDVLNKGLSGTLCTGVNIESLYFHICY
jgi:hypothetical protein